MKLILYAAIILSTLCSISEAGTVVSAHWEATITNMDSQISEVRVRRDAADILKCQLKVMLSKISAMQRSFV